MKRIKKDDRDIYYRRAKEENYRARSAYKLIQLIERYGLLDDDEEEEEDGGGVGVVDLCAAPGSWSQVLRRLVRGDRRVVAVDIQPMSPIDGVVCLCGDITTSETAARVIAALGGSRASLLVSDGAPDVTGVHVMDRRLHTSLLEAAFSIMHKTLAVGRGKFVAKFFEGADESLLTSTLRRWFKQVHFYKPDASRNSSSECFVVALGYNGCNDNGDGDGGDGDGGGIRHFQQVLVHYKTDFDIHSLAIMSDRNQWRRPIAILEEEQDANRSNVWSGLVQVGDEHELWKIVVIDFRQKPALVVRWEAGENRVGWCSRSSWLYWQQ